MNGKLMLEGGHFVARVAGQTVTLNEAEGAVFRRLVERRDRMVSADELAVLVCGQDGMIPEKQLTHL